ncbi:MAG: pyruvate kinase [Limisphaerales bacterium]
MKSKFDLAARTSDSWKVPDVMATIGPTLEKPVDLQRAIEAGAHWLRLPCGYRQRPHLENARAVRTVADQLGIPVQLLLDLPSSRPRTGSMPELKLSLGQRVLFQDPEVSGPALAPEPIALIPLPGLVELLPKLRPQHRMWFCDGRLSFVVEELQPAAVVARLEKGTIPLKSSNALFLPDSQSAFSVFTSLDRELLAAMAAAKLPPDWVALSLIGSPADVRAGRKEIRGFLGPDVRVMAKFETVAAVDSAAEIIDEADGIMVARGDLGLAVGYVRLPSIQEQLVAAARQAGKVTVVATQVLEAFAETGLPLRAELSDLSLVARQRADVVMLGKETVFSPRPIECIRLAREVMTYETRRFENCSGLSAPSAARVVP